MSAIKEHYHDEIEKGQRKANNTIRSRIKYFMLGLIYGLVCCILTLVCAEVFKLKTSYIWLSGWISGIGYIALFYKKL
jgi:hypothetical protein